MTSFLAAERDAIREALVGQGFGDDGGLLRGPVAWSHPRAGAVTARVEVLVPDAFPFVPPKVRVIDVGTSMPLTFHVERPGEGESVGWLCLWESSHDVGRAPWRDAAALTNRVAGHLERTAAGWLGDTDCDLERYLPVGGGLVLYDRDHILAAQGKNVRVRAGTTPGVVTITAAARTWPEGSRRRAGRKDHGLAYVDDVGELSAPIAQWSDVRELLPGRADRLSRDIHLGIVTWAVLRYTRSGQPSVLVMRTRAVSDRIDLRAVESADTSEHTRQLRAGPQREALADARVAIVGLGAVGSFTADILFRAGVRRLTLLDYEVLRPGNVVRHLLGDRYVGQLKADGVAARLGESGTGSRCVTARHVRIDTPEKASGVIRSHDLVIDATGDALATGLLAAGADADVQAGSGPRVLSACVQRQGQIVRVDALPAQPHEPHLPALHRRDTDHLTREQGCGSPVSLTPPGSVIACAELVSRLAISRLADVDAHLPSSVVTVLTAQPEQPYDRPGTVTSRQDHTHEVAPISSAHASGS